MAERTGSPGRRVARRRVHQVDGEGRRWRQDLLAVEEPLEIRLCPPAGDGCLPVAVTMRTPGEDFELAAGFLVTEGLLPGREAFHSITYCDDPDPDGVRRYNIINVNLMPGFEPVLAGLEGRRFYTASSCGICGKASIDAVRVAGVAPCDAPIRVTPGLLTSLAGELRRSQPIFDRTGGLHAAGLFDPSGGLRCQREDVGRHNAVDKVIGRAVLDRELPLSKCILVVSGRAGFEIVQKAAVAGIPVVAAVSAPSSLACDLARELNLTLIGFLREGRFNVYTGSHRVIREDEVN